MNLFKSTTVFSNLSFSQILIQRSCELANVLMYYFNWISLKNTEAKNVNYIFDLSQRR